MPLQLFEGWVFVAIVITDTFDVKIRYIWGHLLLVWRDLIQRIFDCDVCHVGWMQEIVTTWCDVTLAVIFDIAAQDYNTSSVWTRTTLQARCLAIYLKYHLRNRQRSVVVALRVREIQTERSSKVFGGFYQSKPSYTTIAIWKRPPWRHKRPCSKALSDEQYWRCLTPSPYI